MPYFWQKFDKQNYSLWFCEYNYADDLKMIFMTCNLIGGQSTLSPPSLHPLSTLSTLSTLSILSILSPPSLHPLSILSPPSLHPLFLLVRFCLCHAAPPSVVGGAHNSHSQK